MSINGIDSIRPSAYVKSECTCPKCKEQKNEEQIKEDAKILTRQLEALAYIAKSLIEKKSDESDEEYETKVELIRKQLETSLKDSLEYSTY